MPSLTVPFWQVDAFTAEPFSGNPAAVCLFKQEQPPEDASLRSIAAEMNLSETAFLCPLPSPGGVPRFGLRWFTPTNEVPLCGHAALAAAWVLFQELDMSSETVLFETASGELSALRIGEKIGLDLPRHDCEKADAPAGLLEALGSPKALECAHAAAGENLILRVENRAALLAVRPDFGRLRDIRADKVSGVIVTCAGDGEYDFLSRYFSPWHGINEDPVTGSAHAALAPFWSARQGGKRLFFARQESARGGDVGVRLEERSVRLAGDAVTVLRGELTY